MVQLQTFTSALNLSIKTNRFFFTVPKTKFILSLVKILIKYNYFLGFTNCVCSKNKITVFFRLNLAQKKSIISSFKLVSTSSRPVYIRCKSQEKTPASALFLVSTNCGVMSHKEAFSKKLGGTILCKVI